MILMLIIRITFNNTNNNNHKKNSKSDKSSSNNKIRGPEGQGPEGLRRGTS